MRRMEESLLLLFCYKLTRNTYSEVQALWEEWLVGLVA